VTLDSEPNVSGSNYFTWEVALHNAGF
jgi:hypothetical protein